MVKSIDHCKLPSVQCNVTYPLIHTWIIQSHRRWNQPTVESVESGLMLQWRHYHDDVIKWKHFPRNWPFVWEIHRSPVNSPHKGQWRGALMFSLICAWINDWVNNREAGDLRRHRTHYDVIIMTATSLGLRDSIEGWQQNRIPLGSWY